MEKSAFLHEMHNTGPILAQHWYDIILRIRVESILGYWLVIGKPRVMLTLRKNVDQKEAWRNRK